MECHSELVEVLGNYALKYRTVARWVGKLKQLRVSTCDEQRSGRLTHVATNAEADGIQRLPHRWQCVVTVAEDYIKGGVGSSGSERYHFLEDQDPGQTSHGENRLIVRNARVQPTVSLATVQEKVATSLGASVSSQTIRGRLVEGHLGLRRPLRALPLTPTHPLLRWEWCRARENYNALE
ncbi:transposable element Tcb2 transposase [Trichonephila clavipes]|nr:transposable element Tcb2 transposase [Trichonephila clavipes]